MSGRICYVPLAEGLTPRHSHARRLQIPTDAICHGYTSVNGYDPCHSTAIHRRQLLGTTDSYAEIYHIAHSHTARCTSTVVLEQSTAFSALRCSRHGSAPCNLAARSLTNFASLLCGATFLAHLTAIYCRGNALEHTSDVCPRRVGDKFQSGLAQACR